jgi:hypothetical protein
MSLYIAFSDWIEIWQRIPLTARLFVVALAIIAIRSFVESVRTWLALRRIRKLDASEVDSARSGLAKLGRNCVNRAIRLQAAFYLFVALVFLLLFNNYRYSVESKSRRMDRS